MADLLRSQQLTEEERRDAAVTFSPKAGGWSAVYETSGYLCGRENRRPAVHPQPGPYCRKYGRTFKAGLRKKKITLKGNYEKGKCLLEPDLLRSLTVNLIDNASKAVGEGGHIWVAVRMTDEGCVLCVDDDGPGIPEEAREHLAEAFYRVDKSRSRTQGEPDWGDSVRRNRKTAWRDSCF